MFKVSQFLIYSKIMRKIILTGFNDNWVKKLEERYLLKMEER